MILLSFCQTVVEPARKAEEVGKDENAVKVSDRGGPHLAQKVEM